MSNLTEIAKENGASAKYKYSRDDGGRIRKTTDVESLKLTPDQLQATVEQVCKPLVDALDMVTKNAMLESSNSTTATLAVWRLQECVMTLKEFRKLIGDIK